MIILCWAVSLYLLVCVARVILSFVPINEGSPFSAIGTIAYALTEPIFAPIRNALPAPGDLPIDFSPAIVMLVLFVLRRILCG